MPDAIFTYRNKKDTTDRWTFIEVEVSLKRPEKLNDIVYNLGVYGSNIWYYIDMDPKKGIFNGLKDALETLTGRDERLRSKFWIYDLAEPDKLIYHYEYE